MGADLEWMTRRACDEGVDPEIFFPHPNDAALEAKSICVQCPVAEQCLIYALAPETRQDFGVWGCMTEKERAALLRSANGPGLRSTKRTNEPTADERCGTYRGATAHRRREEWLCPDCQIAKTDYERERSARAREAS